MLITVDNNFINEIVVYDKPYYINHKLHLYIYNRNYFLNFIFINNIKYINILNNKFYYLISDTEVFKYINSYNLLKKLT